MYIDVGAGSFLAQVAIAAFLGILGAVGDVRRRITSLWKRKAQKDTQEHHD
jgi:hypothetical protein